MNRSTLSLLLLFVAVFANAQILFGDGSEGDSNALMEWNLDVNTYRGPIIAKEDIYIHSIQIEASQDTFLGANLPILSASLNPKFTGEQTAVTEEGGRLVSTWFTLTGVPMFVEKGEEIGILQAYSIDNFELIYSETIDGDVKQSDEIDTNEIIFIPEPNNPNGLICLDYLGNLYVNPEGAGVGFLQGLQVIGTKTSGFTSIEYGDRILPELVTVNEESSRLSLSLVSATGIYLEPGDTIAKGLLLDLGSISAPQQPDGTPNFEVFGYSDGIYYSTSVCVREKPPVHSVYVRLNDEDNLSDRSLTVEPFSVTDGNVYQYIVEEGTNFSVGAYSPTAPLRGVSTLDIVLIQKHILGLTRLVNKRSLVAANANVNIEKDTSLVGAVSSFDLLAIRRLILNVDQALPSGASYVYINSEEDGRPSGNCYAVSSDNIDETKTYNLEAIKLGDVSRYELQNRSRAQIANEVSMAFNKTTLMWDLVADKDLMITGIRIEGNGGFNLSKDFIDDLQETKDSYSASFLMKSADDIVSFLEGEVIGSFTSKDFEVFEVTYEEDGEDFEITKVSNFAETASTSSDQDKTFRAYPNPTSGVINFSKEIPGFQVMDIYGRIISHEYSSDSYDASGLIPGIYIINSPEIDKPLRFIKE